MYSYVYEHRGKVFHHHLITTIVNSKRRCACKSMVCWLRVHQEELSHMVILFYILRNLHIGFHSVNISFSSPKQCIRVHFSWCLHQAPVHWFHHDVIKLTLNAVLLCIPPMVCDAEQFFICLLVIYNFYLSQTLLISLLLNGLSFGICT